MPPEDRKNMYQLVIANGTVVTGGSETLLDIGVVDGRIATLASPGTLVADSADEFIDASGKYVVPGGIDSHVHFDTALTENMSSQSAFAGTRAAAYGGTTTVMDFSNHAGDQSLIESIETKLDIYAKQGANVDFALHAMITGDFPLSVPDEIPEAISRGVVSFKLFTTFSGDSASGTVYSDDGRIFSVMERTAAAGAVTMVHCEDDCIIDLNVRQLYAAGHEHAKNIRLARPNLAEEAAVRRMLLLSERTGARLYIVHVSTHEAVAAIEEAQARRVRVEAEALHPYLVFTSDKYEEKDPMRFHNYPPLKGEEDRQALWKGLANRTIATLASDDFTIPFANKIAGEQVDNASGGNNGVETRMALGFSEGVMKGRIDLRTFVDATSTQPAKLFGIYPQKGLIDIGSDADLVVIDPERTSVVTESDLHSDCDYSNWVGWEFTGFPMTTVLRGQTLVKDGVWVGPESAGQFVPGHTI
jgi:dihydropyrimidinase